MMDMLGLMKSATNKAPKVKGKFKASGNREFRRRQATPEEQSVKFAKDMLTQGHHLQYQTALQHISSALSGSGLVKIVPHYTPSPLSSATLLGTYLKNRLLRNQESLTPQTIRKIIGLADAKNSVWSHTTSQLGRKLQLSQVIDSLALKKEALELRLAVNPDNAGLQRELYGTEQDIRKAGLLLDFLSPKVSGNLHPDSLLANDKASMTPSEMAQLPSPAGTIRGILIRLKGPRKGNRAIKYQMSAGRVSINSVDYVVAEECTLQIPSKLGIFGLYIRIVYSKTDRLIDSKARLRLLEDPMFKFAKTTTY